MTIVVIRNRKNEPEIVIRPERDAKGMSTKKNKQFVPQVILIPTLVPEAVH
jgi:hypothetical protein